ncbi:Gfo/Idh/MocA family oxidoreductase [soil metagenome]
MRAVIVGGGYAAERHVDALRHLDDVEIAAIVGSSEERARAAAQRLGVGRWTADLAEALADASVDVVHVCAQKDMHLPLAGAALGAGKHVLCEKPLALDVAGAELLVELAARSGRLAVLCHNYRFFPRIAALRERVRGGDIGRPHLVRGSFLQDWLLLETDTDWRTDPARAGASRALSDIGTRWMDCAEIVSGQRIVSVTARASRAHAGRGGEDQAALLLGFDGGLEGAVVVSQVAAGHENDLEIAIDGAAASASWRSNKPHELRLSRRGEEPQLLVGDLAVPNESRRLLVKAAYDALRDPSASSRRAVPLPTFADGLHQLRIVAAALESAGSGKVVAVP